MFAQCAYIFTKNTLVSGKIHTTKIPSLKKTSYKVLYVCISVYIYMVS